MAKTTFNKFKAKLEETADSGDGGIWEAPMHGDYNIVVDGNELSVPIIEYVESTNTVYLPKDTGELLPEDDYTHFSGDEVHDFQLLKATYLEV